MMRFPLRLTVDLALARLAQTSRENAASASVLLLAPMEPASPSGLDSSAHHPMAPRAGTELLARVRNAPAPVVWIGGSEPLLHPEMGQLTRCIAGIGRDVFLETDGALLRRRIHEFRPASRLFLTIQWNGLERSHDIRAGGAFRAALEGMRVARLSGFLICVHARVHAETELGEMAESIHFARSLDVDGIVISTANGGSNSANPEAADLQQKILEARKLIGSKWWESFSRLVEPLVSGQQNTTPGAEAVGVRPARGSHANEESVRVA
jgi:MoaA/NifB/PqqE/SkfB family radical SAM enzyme